ncbi:hypothetical protein RBE51_22000 [Pseudomonas taiwanensis]|uniref:hypothetical protein n=1 Tax=Pseudomonas taiwanensis TaxID=470150 RepID=UPI0028DE2BA8|nr:hypothetical protein [Pseudomonas taiwanensis]MDT8925461.1 hypothetical protein [Pseudomonas taiwanensis]
MHLKIIKTSLLNLFATKGVWADRSFVIVTTQSVVKTIRMMIAIADLRPKRMRLTAHFS